MEYLVVCLQSLFLILITPLFVGILNAFKAHLRGYTPAKITQPYYDIKRLFGKGMVISNSSSFITLYGPSIALAFVISASFLIPVFYTSESVKFGNIILLIFIFSAVSVITALIGIDAASTFGGMGSSRENFVHLFVEPVILTTLAFLYFETKSLNTFKMSFSIANSSFPSPAHFLTFIAFFIIVLTINARMPVDNPETHLELTMIHEAMILDLSGTNLAYIELASKIKLILSIALLVNLFIPFGIATTINLTSLIFGLIAFVVKTLFVIFTIALVESYMAKSRLFRVPELLVFAFSLTIISIGMLYFRF